MCQVDFCISIIALLTLYNYDVQGSDFANMWIQMKKSQFTIQTVFVSLEHFCFWIVTTNWKCNGGIFIYMFTFIGSRWSIRETIIITIQTIYRMNWVITVTRKDPTDGSFRPSKESYNFKFPALLVHSSLLSHLYVAAQVYIM